MTALPRPKMNRYLRTIKLALWPTAYFDDYHRQFGDCFAVGTEKTPFVYICDPKAIQTVFGDRDRFVSGGGGGFIETLLGSNSLLLLQGEAHQRQRKLLTPPFQGERLRAYGRTIADIATEVSDRLPVGRSFVVREAMQEITLKVILQGVFGLYGGDRYERSRQLLGSLLGSLSSPLSALFLFFPVLQKDFGRWSPWGRFLRIRAEIDRLLLLEIAERRAKPEATGSDILSLLLTARDETGEGMSDAELRDELMTLLVAGHETTASALSWAFYWIHALPEVEAKLRAELADLGRDPDPDAIAALPYLSAVCSETLRRYPIAFTTFPRFVASSVELAGYEIPAGAIVSPCIYLAHQRESVYPNPQEFRPERFLERQFSPYEYLPFGGGDRRCIGMGLAMMEMKLVLATWLARHRFQCLGTRSPRPVRRGLTVAPPANLRLKVLS